MADKTQKRILFVDDEPNVLDGIRRRLRPYRSEWHVCFASSVSAALEAMEGEEFDAVVTDIDMPGRNGFDLLRRIREDARFESIPVAILTGQGDSKVKHEALDRGATDLLNKPVATGDLIARVRSMLRMKEYEDRIRAHAEELEQRVLERTAQLELAQAEMIWRLGRAGEFRDSDTGQHVVRVGFYTRALAREMGLDLEFTNKVFLTSPLHDIGKIGVPDGILLKPGKLTDEEWVQMRQHTTIGAQILQADVIAEPHLSRLDFFHISGTTLERNPLIQTAAEIARHHHERWDGQGYPDLLAGDRIPLSARLTSVADVFDALSSDRPYREALPLEEVLTIMRRGAGTQFNPEVFSAFEQSLDVFEGIRTEFSDAPHSSPQQDILRSVHDLRIAS